MGLRWHPALGQVTLSGPLLRLAADCDRAFGILADAFGAQEEQHPAAVSAELLDRLDYFSSFPHQATFPAVLEDPAGWPSVADAASRAVAGGNTG